MNAPYPLEGKGSSSSVEPPVIQKDLEDDVIAEANKDGTIYLDKDIDLNSKKAKEAIKHEKVHLEQFASGDLDYTDDYVIWKGKKYPRKFNAWYFVESKKEAKRWEGCTIFNIRGLEHM